MPAQGVTVLQPAADDRSVDSEVPCPVPGRDRRAVGTDVSAEFVRKAMKLREAGALDKAVAHLRGRDPRDFRAALIYFKLLYELQAYGELQEAVLGAVGDAHRIPADTDPEYLILLLRFAQRVCLPIEVLEKLADNTNSLARRNPAVVKTWRALLHRLRFRRHMATQYTGAAAVISLGLHCLPWHLPSLWGFRDATQYRTQLSSFSLASHQLAEVIRALEENFDGYCETETIRLIETANGHIMPMRKDRGAVWNHHRGKYWTADDFALLRDDSREKAEAFRMSCRDSNVVFLISKIEHEFPNEALDFLPALNAGLAQYTGTDRNRIVISNQTAEGRPPRMYSVDKTTLFFYCPYPRVDYVWHIDDIEDSVEGLSYERRFASLLAIGLARLGVFEQRNVGDEETVP